MGVVYKARQKGLNRFVAIKMIPANARASEDDLLRFRLEAEAVAQVQHPNIVQIYEVGEHHGRPFFSMEFIDGENLQRKIGGAAWPPRQAAALIEKLARAMHVAHSRGIVHRDLKPANILFSRKADAGKAGPKGGRERHLTRGVSADEYEPKITDFGLAKQLNGQTGNTQTGTVMGTPSYMAPEQARGQISLLGPVTDVYALSALLYEVLTGQPPFRGESYWDTLAMVVTKKLTPPGQLEPRVPRDLEAVCMKGMEREIGKRYPSAEALADDLRRYLNGEPVSVREAGAVRRLSMWARRKPAMAALVGCLVLLVAAVFVGSALAAVRFREIALVARRNEEEARRSAEEAERAAAGERTAAQQAQQQRREADAARVAAEKARHEAEQAQKQIEKVLARETLAREEAVQERGKAEAARAQAETALKRELLARREAEKATQEKRDTQAKLLREIIKQGAVLQNQITPDELASLKADARQAIKVDPTSTKGYQLLGDVLLQQGREEADRHQQESLFGEAVKNYTAALALREKDDPEKERPEILFVRSKAYLERGFRGGSKEAQKEFFTRALEDAVASIQAGYAHLDYANTAKGIALEDLAYQVGDKARYPEAVAAYSEAIKSRKSQAKFWIDRGRCEYKWAAFGGEPGQFREAREDLEQALRLKPGPVEEAEACYWLANVAWWHKPADFARADEYFQRAVVAAERAASPAWELVARREGATLALARFGQDPAPDFLNTARERAVRLAAFARARRDEATLLQASSLVRDVGRALEAANKPAEALKLYQSALPANPLAATAAQLPLLNARNRLFVSPAWQEALKDDKPAPEVLLKQAEHGVALADDPSLAAADKAEAFGAAGLCYQDAASQSEAAADRRRYRTASLERLEKAVRLDPQNRRSWTWHKALGEQALQLLNGTNDAARWRDYRDQAEKHLDRAYDLLKNSKPLQQEILQLKEKLETSRPPAE
jgi:tetratricopeptide (TPR) repeat protein